MTFYDANRQTIEERSNDPPEEPEQPSRRCPKCGSEMQAVYLGYYPCAPDPTVPFWRCLTCGPREDIRRIENE